MFSCMIFLILMLNYFFKFRSPLPPSFMSLFLAFECRSNVFLSTVSLRALNSKTALQWIHAKLFCYVLQRFFGIVRQSSGSDDHPSANQFLYIYRLLSVSNLVKPGKRTSVRCDPGKILLTVQSVVPEPRIPFVPGIETLLDSILAEQSEENLPHHLPEHDYIKSTPEECIQFYLGGYVAHKLSKYTTCNDCVMSLSDVEILS